MEVFALLIPLFTFIIPIFVMFIIYAAILALAIWFVITFLNNQKERNRLLAEISSKMKVENPDSREEKNDVKSDEQSHELNEMPYKNDSL